MCLWLWDFAGFSLPQPHLDRTKLCDLDDAELDPKYLHQRDALKEVVQQLVKRKVVGGSVLTGAQLADLLQSLVSALNAKEIPTAAGLIESFNREIIGKALAEYARKMDAVKLPVQAEKLAEVRHMVLSAWSCSFILGGLDLFSVQ